MLLLTLVLLCQCSTVTPITTYYDSGEVKELFFTDEDNKKQGKYTLYHKNGSVKEIGVYKNGLEHGTFIQYRHNQIESSYEKKEGKLNGYWRMYHTETGKLRYEDQFLNDTLNGLCKRYYRDGTLKYQCVFKDDLPYNGIWVNRVQATRITKDNDTIHYYLDINYPSYGNNKVPLYRYTNGIKEKTSLTLW